MKPIRYAVEIQGARAPYRWQIVKHIGSSITRTGAQGECDTITEAKRDAMDAALAMEEERVHIETRQEVDLFNVDEAGHLVIEEAPDSLPSDW